MRIEELRRKQVINCCDCKVLGCVEDIEFDLCNCCITCLIVPGPNKWCGLVASEHEFVIPCSCIEQIGADIILVKVDENHVKRKRQNFLTKI